ncbi:MAG: prolyl-tRNA synthetase associated domain-containing protein [Pseudomonadota bacterium]
MADEDLGEEAAQAQAALYGLFAALDLTWRHHAHPPFHTVEESRAMRGEMPGAHVKNLFLKDKKGTLWLVTCLEDRQIRIRDLEKAVDARKASFGNADLLWQTLAVRPGAVTPFALMRQTAADVRFVLDAAVPAHGMFYAHPLHNRATTAMPWGDVARFFAHVGHTPLMLDFAPLEALAREHAARETGA